jgi:hypothetical protein
MKHTKLALAAVLLKHTKLALAAVLLLVRS